MMKDQNMVKTLSHGDLVCFDSWRPGTTATVVTAWGVARELRVDPIDAAAEVYEAGEPLVAVTYSDTELPMYRIIRSLGPRRDVTVLKPGDLVMIEGQRWLVCTDESGATIDFIIDPD